MSTTVLPPSQGRQTRYTRVPDPLGFRKQIDRAMAQSAAIAADVRRTADTLERIEALLAERAPAARPEPRVRPHRPTGMEHPFGFDPAGERW